MAVNPLDIVFGVVLLVAGVRCALKGFIAEAMSMAALILGVAAAVFFSKPGATLIAAYFGQSNWNQVIAFLILFLVVYLIVKILQRILQGLFERIHLDQLDRALGLFLGLAEGVLLVVLVVYVLQVQPLIDLSKLIRGSFIASTVLKYLPLLVPGLQQGAATTNV